MCEIQRFFIFPQNDWKKALELILALNHDKSFCLCFFWGGDEKKSIQRGKDVLVFKVNPLSPNIDIIYRFSQD